MRFPKFNDLTNTKFLRVLVIMVIITLVICPVADREYLICYKQSDKKWGSIKFSGGTIGHDGCGLTCLAMIEANLHNEKYTPADAAAEYNAWRPSQSQTGTSSEFVKYFCKEHEFVIKGTDKNKAAEQLQDGGFVLVLLKPGSKWSSVGHYILLYGFDDDEFKVMDPNSTKSKYKTASMDDLRYASQMYYINRR